METPEKPERSDAEFQQSLDARQREVNNALNTGNPGRALSAALQDPPLGCKNQQIRDASTQAVVNVLTSVKDADMQKNIDALSPTDLDTLMKYIYRGLEDGENSTSLLKWHEAVTKKGGLGCIVRALAERKAL